MNQSEKAQLLISLHILGTPFVISDQVDRIKAVRKAADAAGVPMFINARTDLFLKEKNGGQHAALLPGLLTRILSRH